MIEVLWAKKAKSSRDQEATSDSLMRSDARSDPVQQELGKQVQDRNHLRHRTIGRYRESRSYVAEHRESFERAGEAILSKIMDNERVAEAIEESGGAPAPAFPGVAREPDEKAS